MRPRPQPKSLSLSSCWVPTAPFTDVALHRRPCTHAHDTGKEQRVPAGPLRPCARRSHLPRVRGRRRAPGSRVRRVRPQRAQPTIRAKSCLPLVKINVGFFCSLSASFRHVQLRTDRSDRSASSSCSHLSGAYLFTRLSCRQNLKSCAAYCNPRFMSPVWDTYFVRLFVTLSYVQLEALQTRLKRYWELDCGPRPTFSPTFLSFSFTPTIQRSLRRRLTFTLSTTPSRNAACRYSVDGYRTSKWSERAGTRNPCLRT